MKASKAATILTLAIITTVSTIVVSSTMATSVLAQPDYTRLVSASSTSTPGAALFLSVTTGGAIPRFPDDYIRSVLVFGYAWVDTTTGNGIVAAIHPGFRDSNQNPSGWHTHSVILSSRTSSSDFCIQQLGTSQGGISIINNKLSVHIPVTLAPNLAASSVVQQDSGCTATGLGVKVLSTAAVSH
jgi:hypothetical protein